MDVSWRLLLIVVALTVTGLAWAWLRRRRGQLRSPSRGGQLPDEWASEGTSATLVQISSPACSACVHAARVWTRLTAGRDDIYFVQADAAEYLDWVREQRVLSTPTTLLYDARGVLTGRIVGAPTPVQARSALAQTTQSTSPTCTGATA